MIEVDTSAIEFIYCSQYKEGYYSYSINDIENSMLIKKSDLEKLIRVQLGCSNDDLLFYLMDRNLPFLYKNKDKKIYKFKVVNKEINKDELLQGMFGKSEIQGLQLQNQFSVIERLYKR